MAEPKKQDVKELGGMDAYDVVSLANKMVDMRNENSIKVGVIVTDKKLIEGKPKKDKQGNETGEFWADKYAVSFEGMGLKFSKMLDKSTAGQLDVGQSYYIVGRLEATTVNAISKGGNEYDRGVFDLQILSIESVEDKMKSLAQSYAR